MVQVFVQLDRTTIVVGEVVDRWELSLSRIGRKLNQDGCCCKKEKQTHDHNMSYRTQFHLSAI